MNVRLTGILATVLAALIVAYFWAGKAGQERKQAEEEKARIVKVKADKVVALDLIQAKPADPQSKEISLFKQEGIWRISKPLALRAEKSAVDDLLSSLEAVKKERVIDEAAKDLSAYGLNPAQVAVRYKMEGGGKGGILFGEKSPSGEGIYMALDGSKKVYLLAAGTRARFEKKLPDVRDKTILRRPRGKVSRIVYERDGGRFTLNKKRRDAWDLIEPVKAKGDHEAANRTIDLLIGGKAQRYLTENPTDADLSKFGLTSPRLRLTLAEAEGKNPDVFLIGRQNEKSKGYYARKEAVGPIFELERFSVDDLPKSPLEARNRRIYEFEKEAVEKIELDNSEGKVVIRKTGKDEWEVEGNDAKLPGNDRRISDMLWDIKYLKIAKFFDDPAAQPNVTLVDRTTRKVALHIQGMKEPLRFSVGQQGPSDLTQKDKEDQERWYAKRPDGTAPFLLTRDTVDRISKGVWDFQERKALLFEYNAVGKIRFGYPNAVVELTKEGRRWRMRKPLDEIAVGDKMDFIVNEIYLMEFETVAKENIPDFSKPDLVVDVTLKDGKSLPTLRLVRDAKAQIAYVRRGEEKAIYTIEDRFIDNVPKGFKGFLSKE